MKRTDHENQLSRGREATTKGSATWATRSAALGLLLVAGLGCPMREASEEPQIGDAGSVDRDSQMVGDAGSDTEIDATGRPKLQPPARKAIGETCALSGDCASGFCADGVCCETSCEGTCAACNIAGSVGQCTGLNNVEDPTGTPPCIGAYICSTDGAGVAACLLKDGQACSVPADCASGYCRTYYRNQDGDDYGSESSGTIVQCDVVARAPAGFAAVGGDCCDSDPAAHPGVTSYFTTRDGCGNYDWNCSGGEEQQANGSCPATNGAPLACGQACTVVFKGTGSTLFVQACH